MSKTGSANGSSLGCRVGNRRFCYFPGVFS